MSRYAYGMAALMVLLGGWGVPARAGDNEVTTMGEVVVTASRQEEEIRKVPAHVTVVTAEEIVNSTAQNVPEVLESVGVHVTDYSGNKRTYVVDLRGFGEVAPMNMLVLVDGRRITQADLGGTDWTLIPLERIERIEIIPGSRGSVFYGDNATGGVINIITKEGVPGNHVSAEMQYGSYETYKAAAGFSGAQSILSYNVLGGYYNTDGYRDNGDSEAKDFGATMRLDPNDAVSMDLSGGYHQDSTGLPGPLSQSDLDSGMSRTSTNTPDNYADTKDYYVKGGVEFFILSNDSFRLDSSLRRRDVTWYATYGSFSSEYNSKIDSYSISPRFSFNEEFGEVSNRLIIGADFSQDKLDAGGSSDLKKKTAGYYIHDDLGVNRDLTLSGGYRYDRAAYDLAVYGLSDHYNYDEEAFTLGINRLLGGVKLFANYGKSYRYPALDELFNYETFSYLALEPQVSDSWEVGAKIHILTDLALTLNIFSIETEKEIFLNPSTGLFGINENFDGDTDRKGMELKVGFEVDGWSMGGSYTYTHATIKNGQYEGRRVPNVPYNLVSANLGYTFAGGLFAGLDGSYVDKRYFISDFSNQFDELDSYILVNARINYPWHWLTFFVDLNNIFNETYASIGTISGGERQYYPSPEFNMLVGIKARFDGI